MNLKLFAALTAVLLLAGCAGSSRSRALDLNLPTPDKLVITVQDYPDFTQASADPMSKGSWINAIDGLVVTIYKGGGGEDRVEIRSAAFRFYSEADAQAGFKQVSDGVGDNATRPDWGDEAVRTITGGDQAFFRDRSVLFAASLTSHKPTNVTLEQIVEKLLAKMPARP